MTKNILDNCTVVMPVLVIIEHVGDEDNTFITWNEYQKYENKEKNK